MSESVRETPQACVETFTKYESSHLAKGTGDGLLKATPNRVMAERCREAIRKINTAPLTYTGDIVAADVADWSIRLEVDQQFFLDGRAKMCDKLLLTPVSQ
jgi:hypothetical protein